MAVAWRLAHEEHAIAGMACSIGLSSPLPEKLLRKTLERAEEAARSVGLRVQNSLIGLVRAPQAPGPIERLVGKQFNSEDEIPSEIGLNVDYPRQFVVEQSSVVYRTSIYRGWAHELEDMRKLFEEVLPVVVDVVGLASVKLEYRDVFYADDAESSDIHDLLREDSHLIAPHIFSTSEIWHSYTGYMLPPASAGSRIAQVNIDYLDIPNYAGKRRHVQLGTVREDRLPFGSVENAEYNSDLLVNLLSTMHQEVLDLLKRVVKPPVLDRMGLGK